MKDIKTMIELILFYDDDHILSGKFIIQNHEKGVHILYILV